MKYKQRILRGPKRPSFFKSPLFYLSVIILIGIGTFYLLTGREILKNRVTQKLSLQLRRQGEVLSHLLYHQFFVIGLKKEDVVSTLRKGEKDRVTWNVYQIEIHLPEHLSVQEVSESFQYQIRITYPSLTMQSRLLENGKYQLVILKDGFILVELTFIPFSASKPSQAEPRAGIKGRIAIVIDDFGPNLTIAREFLALNCPLTFSVLPFYKHSKDIATEAHSQGREVMLHLPLEPLNNEENKLEKGTLYTSMDESTLLTQLREELSSVPHVDGVNGHMGSKFTGDRKSMEILLRELKSRGLFFLDSLTTEKSVGSSVAQEIKITFGKRDLFLDRDIEGSTIEERLLQLSHLAKKRGHAIGIAHPYPDTLNALKKMLPLLSSEGIEVFPVSQIIGHVTE